MESYSIVLSIFKVRLLPPQPLNAKAIYPRHETSLPFCRCLTSTPFLGVIVPRKPEGPRVAPGTRSLSALQQLAAARKAEQHSVPNTGSAAANTSALASPNIQPSAKPLSKLAQLAAQRKAAANATSSAKESPVVAISDSPKLPLSTPATQAQEKPVSKLAQRIAAAKAAKAQAAAAEISKPISAPGAQAVMAAGSQSMEESRGDAMDVDSEERPSPLFTFPTQLEQTLPHKAESSPQNISFSAYAGTRPSGFFTLLTTPPKTTRLVPGDLEKDALEKRQRRSKQGKDPFEELDPDEAVMKAREGTRLDPGAPKARK